VCRPFDSFHDGWVRPCWGRVLGFSLWTNSLWVIWSIVLLLCSRYPAISFWL
jgi:hypothetical protein